MSIDRCELNRGADKVGTLNMNEVYESELASCDGAHGRVEGTLLEDNFLDFHNLNDETFLIHIVQTLQSDETRAQKTEFN